MVSVVGARSRNVKPSPEVKVWGVCRECASRTPWDRASRTVRCPNCGGEVQVTLPDSDALSTTAKVFTGVFIGWALLFPFLVPIILKLSR